MNKPIKAVSRVIELKSGRKYLLVFSEKESLPDAQKLINALKEEGIVGLGLALREGNKLEVIEVEGEKK